MCLLQTADRTAPDLAYSSQIFTLGIGISMAYGVSKKSLAYPFEIPPEADGDGLLVATDQISLEGKVCVITECSCIIHI